MARKIKPKPRPASDYPGVTLTGTIPSGCCGSCDPPPAVQRFATGAVRGTDRADVRYDLMPWDGLSAVLLWAKSSDEYPIAEGPSDEIETYIAACLHHAAGLIGDYLVRGVTNDLERAGLALVAALESDGLDAVPKRFQLASRYPGRALRELARTCAEGAAKYGEHNWRKGIPTLDLLNHALAHLADYGSGDRSEPHLAHALWNVCVAADNAINRPEMQAGVLSGPNPAA